MQSQVLNPVTAGVSHISSDFSSAAEATMSFLAHNRENLVHSQLSLWTTRDHINEPLPVQLGSGCGSLRRLNSPYIDEDFSVPVDGTEFLNPIVQFMKDRGVKLCRPMLRVMAPKTCLSYHRDGNAYRIHLVCQTNASAMFIVDGEINTMPLVGSLYSLRTDLLHTAMNANYEKERIHLTFTISN